MPHGPGEMVGKYNRLDVLALARSRVNFSDSNRGVDVARDRSMVVAKRHHMITCYGCLAVEKITLTTCAPCSVPPRIDQIVFVVVHMHQPAYDNRAKAIIFKTSKCHS